MLTYSAASAPALALLKKGKNDISIFVEDKSCVAMWNFIVEKSLDKKIKFNTVTMLGGRGQVEEAARNFERSAMGRAIFLIDGDFDFLSGRRKAKIKNLYRIKSYCIEGILINKLAVEKISSVGLAGLTNDRVSARVAFRVWEQQNIEILKSLFVLYAVSNKLSPSAPTISLGVSGLYESFRGVVSVCPKKLFSRMLSVARRTVAEVGVAAFRRELQAVRSRADKLKVRQMISGKDYMLPLVRMHINNIAKLKLSFDQLRVMLSQHWEAAAEPGLVRRLRRL